MEKRLIDANNAISVLKILSDKCCDDNSFEQAISVLESVPTIDAVEVVRCGECGLRYKPLDDDVRNEIYCTFIGSTMRKDDFCSYGCADGEEQNDENPQHKIEY